MRELRLTHGLSYDPRMDTSDIATLTLGVAILGFLWTLHQDIASLRERMARLEGAVDLLAGVMLNSARRHSMAEPKRKRTRFALSAGTALNPGLDRLALPIKG